MIVSMTIQFEITPEIQEVLNYERYHHLVPLVQRRMEVLWLKSHDLPHALIAKLAGVSENTIREYFQLFIAGGTEKLQEVDFYRPESDLVNHTTSLEAYFRDNPPATIKEAQSEIETLTGIKRSETQVAEFLKKNFISVVAKSGCFRRKRIPINKRAISLRKLSHV
jgi:transposase